MGTTLHLKNKLLNSCIYIPSKSFLSWSVHIRSNHFYEIVQEKQASNQHCGCWWLGALAPGHQHHWYRLTPNYTPRIVQSFNTLRPRQNGRHFADDVFKCIFLNKNVWIPIKISLKFVPNCSINNIPSLFQIMAWRRPGDKPLSEPMMVSSLTHICDTRPQWVKGELVDKIVTILHIALWNVFLWMELFYIYKKFCPYLFVNVPSLV